VRRPRTFCADVARANGEPLGATASRIDHWLLIEYRGPWGRDELGQSLLPKRVKAHLRAQLGELPRSRLLFLRRPERRGAEGIAVFRARTSEVAPSLRRLELSAYDELLELDLGAEVGEPLERPLLVVCTHGKRDPCCARYGRPLYEGLREETDDDWVWQSTHVGGDRFAGNLVCFPEGLYFGRVSRPEAVDVLAEYLAGRIQLDRYRGRCCYPFHVQAAELAVRRATDATGIDELRLLDQARSGGGTWTVRFAVAGWVVEAEVRAELGDLTELTCSAATPKRPRRYSARVAGSPPGPVA
jgi:hypothetical protein